MNIKQASRRVPTTRQAFFSVFRLPFQKTHCSGKKTELRVSSATARNKGATLLHQAVKNERGTGERRKKNS